MYLEDDYISTIDWLLLFFLMPILYKISVYLIQKKSINPSIKKILIAFFWLKMLATILYAIYYQYIWGFGDTFNYYKSAYYIQSFSNSDFQSFMRLLFNSVASTLDLRQTGANIDFILVFESNVFQSRLIAAFMFLTQIKSYLHISIFFSFFSFLIIINAYLVFTRIFPGFHKQLAFAFLFFPSVIFWSSGLGKDMNVYTAVLGFISYIFQIFFVKKNIFRHCLYTLAAGYLILIVKPFVLISLLPSVLLGLMLYSHTKIKNPAYRVVFDLLIIVLGVSIILGWSAIISQNLTQYNLDNIYENIANSNTNLQFEAGSAFNIGINAEEITSTADLLKFFPIGLATTLFRPWLWEVHNVSILFSAIESLFMLFLLLSSLDKIGVLPFLKKITSNPLLLLLLIYALIFAGTIGISTSNFGSLVRYKITCMPFIVFSILYVRQKKIAVNL